MISQSKSILPKVHYNSRVQFCELVLGQQTLEKDFTCHLPGIVEVVFTRSGVTNILSVNVLLISWIYQTTIARYCYHLKLDDGKNTLYAKY